MPELAMSSWSVHRTLGPTYPGLGLTAGPRAPEYPYGGGSLALLDLPAAAAAHGIRNLELCHFHFPRTDAAYLRELRLRFDEAGVVPLTLLIDAGDVSAADDDSRDRDLASIRAWIDVAAALGARQVRAIAGLARPEDADAVQRSGDALAALAQYGATHGVRVLTENWLALSMRPETLLAVLDRAGPAVRLCVDFGNYTGPAKYEALALIMPRAVTVHAKADYPQAGRMDEEDFRHCLDLSRQAGFDGHYVLIFDGDGDEWTRIGQMIPVVQPYL